MFDNGDMVGGGLLVLGGLFVACLLVGALFVHSGRQRSALVACALPLVLLLPTLAVSYSGLSLMKSFQEIAEAGGGGERAMISACLRLWMLVRMAAGVVAALSLLALLLGIVPMKAAPALEKPAGSALRRVMLLLLPLCALLLVGGLVSQFRSALRMTLLVVTTPKDDAAKQSAIERMAAMGIENLHSSAGIAETSAFIGVRSQLAGLGGIALLVVLTGLSLTSLLLAAPLRTETAFAGAASLLWLVVSVLAVATAVGGLVR